MAPDKAEYQELQAKKEAEAKKMTAEITSNFEKGGIVTEKEVKETAPRKVKTDKAVASQDERDI